MFKLIKQHDIKDCGAACLSMVCHHYGLKLPTARLRELIKVDNQGASIYGIVDGAGKLGLHAEALQGNPAEFMESINKREISTPFIAHVIIDEMVEHYIVIYKMSSKYVYAADPGTGMQKYKYKDFFGIWTGHIITFEKTEKFKKRNECRGSLIRFIKLVTNQKRLICAVLVTSILISVIGILGAFIFKIIIDTIESNYTEVFWGYTLTEIFGAIILLYCFQAIMEILRGLLLAKLSARVDIPLMLNFYNHIANLPINHLENRKAGEIISRFTDASEIRDAVSGVSLSLILDTFMVIICIIVLYSLNCSLFYITLIVMLIYSLVIAGFSKPIKNVNERLMEKNAIVTSYLKESIEGIETVKAYGAENTVKEKFEKKYRTFVKSNIKGSVIYSLQKSISGLIASIGVVIVLCHGTSLVLNNEISLGTLITFYSLFGYFLGPIKNLVGLQPELQTALVAADRLNDILDLETEEACEDKLVLDNNIEMKHVNFRYGNRELILKDININIKSGERIAIIGESGAGKTTLAKLLMAFHTPERGQIFIGGIDISEINPCAVRHNISYISQNVFLFSDSIKNNLTLGNDKFTLEEIKQACKASMADTFIEKLPMGYNTMLGENGYELSGGEKQRIAIARALLRQPKIIIMDEATSNLDVITEYSIKETIDNLRGNVTCIIIAHRLSTIKNCDTIYVMDAGTIVEFGSHDELILKNGLYKTLIKNHLS